MVQRHLPSSSSPSSSQDANHTQTRTNINDNPASRTPSTSGSTLSARVPFIRTISSDPPSSSSSSPHHLQQNQTGRLSSPSSTSTIQAQQQQQHQPPPSPRLRHLHGSTTSASGIHTSQHPSATTPNHSVDLLPIDVNSTTTSLTQHGPSASNHTPLPRTKYFDPTLPQQSRTPPPDPYSHTPTSALPQKEKSSFDMDDDTVASNHYYNSNDINHLGAATIATAVPDRFNTQTPAFMSSDGDASSHSGPSRTSTPFYGEWTDATDYESAYEGETMIPMNDVHATRNHHHHHDHHSDYSDSAAMATTPTTKAMELVEHPSGNKKTGLYINPDIARQSRSPQGASNRSAGQSWSRWWKSITDNDREPTRLFKSRGKARYQRLNTSTDSPKSPDFRHLYPHSRGATNRGNKTRFHPSMLLSPRQLGLFLFRSVQTFLSRYHPLTLVAALLFVAGFIASTTLLIIWILNPDKEPKPWRTFCAQSEPFPHQEADSLAPVDVFVGVMTTDARSERRSIIRATYATHTRPVDPITGLETSNVQLKFVMGRPRKAFERRVALEMEMYNDIVVLDTKENMNGGKTHEFFKWAAENATVPILVPHGSEGDSAGEDAAPSHANVGAAAADRVGGRLDLAHATSAKQFGSNKHPRGTVEAANGKLYDIAWKKADYVVKADDDAFLRLDELERHLRVSPRKMTYWGYLIRNWFMGGESYAVSADLVQYFATSPFVAAHVKGKEDKVTARWISAHPNFYMIKYISEHCWIYDHPKTGTAYAHGFLFPDEVERIKMEEHRGLSDKEIAHRGGEHASKWYSTVSHWKQKYTAPRSGLSIEEEMEALVEGGGIYQNSDYRSGASFSTPWSNRVYEAEDPRLKELGRGINHGLNPLPARLRADWKIDEWTSLPVFTRANGTESSDEGSTGVVSRRRSQDEDLASEEEEEEEEEDATSSSSAANRFLNSLPLVGAFKHLASVSGGPRSDENSTSSAANAPRKAFVQREQRPPTSIPIPQDAAYLSSSFGDVSISDLHAARYLISADSDKNVSEDMTPDSKISATESTSSSRPNIRSHASLRGGTVVVHFLKRNEWFYETALALIGRDRIRSKMGKGTEWSMWGSPDGHAVVGRRVQ
ncbi:unnamed protein product [Sympodiomycopsis kandeliae]